MPTVYLVCVCALQSVNEYCWLALSAFPAPLLLAWALESGRVNAGAITPIKRAGLGALDKTKTIDPNQIIIAFLCWSGSGQWLATVPQ